MKTWMVLAMGLLVLVGCTSTPPMLIEQCAPKKTLPADYDKSKAHTDTTVYPCWEPIKVGDTEHVRNTRLLYLMDPQGHTHSQEVGP